METATLLEIEADIKALEELIDEVIDEETGEIPEEFEGVIDQWFDEAFGKLEDKADGYGYVMQKYEGMKAESKRLAEKAQKYGNRVDRMKNTLLYVLSKRDIGKLETPRFTFNICNNGGRQPLYWYEGTSEEDLPEEFTYEVKETKVDNDMLREALEQGDERLEGKVELAPRGKHLRVS